MSESITIEKVETDLKKMKKDLTKIRGYVSAHRDELCAMASTNVLNRRLTQYLPVGYAFKRNYGVLGIRSVKGPANEPKTETKKVERPQKRARRIIEPSDDESYGEGYELDEEYSEEEEIIERPKRRIVHRHSESKSKKKVKHQQNQNLNQNQDLYEEEPIQEMQQLQRWQQIEPNPSPIQQPKGFVSNKNIARSIFKEKALAKYSQFF